MANDKYIWDYLLKSIGNEYGVAGLMGNMQAESGLKPTNLQNSFERKLGMTDETYTQNVDNGTYSNFINDGAGYGLVQWTFWTLKRDLLDYVKAHGKSIGNLDIQLEFLVYELQKDFRGVWETLKSATSVRQASDVVLLQFERPSDQGESMQKKRAAYGQEFYDKYAKGTSEAQKSTQHTLQTALKRSNEVRGTYTTICDLNLRYGADPDKFESMVVMPKGTKAICYGYYNIYENTKWLCVVARVNGKSYTGYCSSRYLG